MSRHSVFISYSHRDREWLDRLNIHLRPLVRDNGLVVWDDTRLLPGSLWRDEIAAALASAKVAILLISADFLASDFIANNELPPLLNAARDDGAVILPVVVSASRFSSTPCLAQFQSVNAPSRPLIALARSEQEETLVRLSEAVDRAISVQRQHLESIPDPRATSGLPVIRRLPLKTCLARLGCQTELLVREESFIREWLNRRTEERLGQFIDPDDVRRYFHDLGEPGEVAASADQFCEHLLACSDPSYHLSRAAYLSAKKVREAYHLLKREARSAQLNIAADSPREKLLFIHEYLLAKDRLTFLPAGHLMGDEMPRGARPFCYFAGSFTLFLDLNEIRKVPGAADILTGKNEFMYGAVNSLFRSPDRFIYPILRFTGCLGRTPVS